MIRSFGFSKLRESLLEPAFAVTLGKLRNDSRGCDELNGMPSQDRFAPKSERKLCLPNARWPEQQHVLAIGDPAGARKPAGIQRRLRRRIREVPTIIPDTAYAVRH